MGKENEVCARDSVAESSEKDLMEKITTMEEALEEIQRDKKKRSLIGIVGLLLVLAALLLFLSNLYDFAQNKLRDPEFHKELLTTVSEDLKDISENSPNVKLMIQDMSPSGRSGMPDNLRWN